MTSEDSDDVALPPVPPEVPEEFAAAYRAAYAKALAEQSPHPHRRLINEPDDLQANDDGEMDDVLSERSEDFAVGTHREADDSAWQHIRGSKWFVPALLLLLAVLLIVLAYVMGLVFASHLNASARP